MSGAKKMNDNCPFKIKCRSDCKYINGSTTVDLNDERTDCYGERYYIALEDAWYECVLTDGKVQPRGDMEV